MVSTKEIEPAPAHKSWRGSHPPPVSDLHAHQLLKNLLFKAYQHQLPLLDSLPPGEYRELPIQRFAWDVEIRLVGLCESKEFQDFQSSKRRHGRHFNFALIEINMSLKKERGLLMVMILLWSNLKMPWASEISGKHSALYTLEFLPMPLVSGLLIGCAGKVVAWSIHSYQWHCTATQDFTGYWCYQPQRPLTECPEVLWGELWQRCSLMTAHQTGLNYSSSSRVNYYHLYTQVYESSPGASLTRTLDWAKTPSSH